MKTVHTALLLAVLEALRPMRVIDTHAGAGLHDLGGEDARRTGEAAEGAARLAADPDPPPALAGLKAAVARANPNGGLRWYPGSPRLVVDGLQPGAAYTGFELHPRAHADLTRNLRPPKGVQAQAAMADGYAGAARMLDARKAGRTLLLVDPPFERADDYARIAELTGCMARVPDAGALIWAPLKDLETFERLPRPAGGAAAPAALRGPGAVEAAG